MANNRKRLIRPVTIAKVINYLNAVKAKTDEHVSFSLDQLAREYRISGSNGTALVRLNLLKSDGELWQLTEFFNNDETTAKMVIEEVRQYDSKYHRTIEAHPTANKGTREDNTSDDPLTRKLNEGVQSANLTTMLAKALKQAMPKPENLLFSDPHNDFNDLVVIASAMVGGLYANLGFTGTQIQSSHAPSVLQSINDAIVISAKDLLSKLKA